MLPDIKIKEFYLRYVFNAKRDIEKYQSLLIDIRGSINELYSYIQDYKESLNDNFRIILEEYDTEWNKKEYNESENLYKDITRIIKSVENPNNRSLLVQLIKYCFKLKEEYNTKRLIHIAGIREKLTLKDYKAYVNKYYMGVHKAILNGFGYHFQGGIGTYIINYFKIDNPTKKAIDYAETNRRKKEIIAKGLKPYDDREAAWYKARNIPYDGVEYRVYLDNKFYYEFTFLNSKIFKKKELDYQRTEYVHLKLRGMSYKEMADKLCNNIDDIVNLNVDIKYKLNILLYKYPEKHLNFVRNAEQSKYKY